MAGQKAGSLGLNIPISIFFICGRKNFQNRVVLAQHRGFFDREMRWVTSSLPSNEPLFTLHFQARTARDLEILQVDAFAGFEAEQQGIESV